MLILILFVATCTNALIDSYAPIQADSLNAQESGVSYTFYVKLGTSLSAGQFLNIEFPSEFSDIVLSSSACTINSASQTCSKVGSTRVRISITAALSNHNRLEVMVPGISNPSAAGSTSYFAVYSESAQTQQVLESNYAFGVLAYGSAVSSMTGSIIPTDTKANSLSNWTFRFVLGTALRTQSQFRITFPSNFQVASNVTCTAVSYDGTTVSGAFTCELVNNKLVISGLLQALNAGDKAAFELNQIQNYPTELTANSVNFILETLRPNTYEVVDKVTIGNPQVLAGVFTELSISPYTSENKYAINNQLYTRIEFKTSSEVPSGGSLEVNFQVTPKDCFIESGLTSSSTSIASTTLTVTGFSNISSLTKIQLVCVLGLGSSNVSGITITSKNSSNAVIDSDSSLSITLESFSAFTMNSVIYGATPQSSGAVTLNISPNSDVLPGSSILIEIPTGFSASSEISVSISGDGSAESATASLSGSVINIVTAVDTITSASGGDIIISTSGGGLSYPSKASSIANPYEWVVKITHTDNSVEIGSFQSSLSPSVMTVSVSYLQELDFWSLFTFQFRSDVTLGTGHTIEVEFPTNDGSSNAFPIDLGATSDVPCIGISATCTIVPASTAGVSNPVLFQVTGFSEIIASSTTDLGVFIKTSAVSTNPSIIIRTYETDSNGVKTEFQSQTLSLTFASSGTSWTTNTLVSFTPVTVNSSGQLTVSLQSTIGSTSSDTLMLTFPAAYSFSNPSASLSNSNVTITSILNNSYAPTLIMPVTGGQISQSSVKTLIVSGIVNGNYVGNGSGDIVLSMQNSNTVLNKGTTGTLSGATVADLTLTIDTLNANRKFQDASYKFLLTVNHSVPSTGQIQIVFPADFDISQSSCLHSFSLTGTIACAVSSQTITVTGFDTIATGASFSITVQTVKNPDIANSGSFEVSTQYDTSGASKIESKTDSGFALESELTAKNSDVLLVSFYPKNSGLSSDFQLQFFLEISVHSAGSIEIVFPFTLPSLSSANFHFNKEYTSFSVVSSTLTIVPYGTYVAGEELEVNILDLTVPSASGQMEITAKWGAEVIAEQPTSPSSSFSFSVSGSASASISASVTASPTTACVPSTYTFTLTLGQALSTTDKIYIKFPTEFPAFVGNVQAFSSSSSRADSVLESSVSDDRRIVTISGFGSFSSVVLTLEGVNNPSAVGTTSGIFVGVIDTNGNIARYSSSATVAITAKPGILRIESIAVQNTSIRSTNIFHFQVEIAAFSIPAEIWVEFPSENFENELIGSGSSITCSSALVDMTTTSESSFVTPTCSNPAKNLVKASFNSGTFDSSKFLKLTLSWVKSSTLEGSTPAFVLSVFRSQTISERSFPGMNKQDTIEFVAEKPELIIGNSFAKIEQGLGVIRKYDIFTSSPFIPARSQLNFTYTIESRVSELAIEILPSPATFEQGKLSSEFYIKSQSTAGEGIYIIKWLVTGAEATSYIEPLPTCLYINPALTHLLSFDSVPILLPGGSSLPLNAYVEASPSSSLTVNFTAPTGLTIPNVTFVPMDFTAIFTISVNSTVASGTYQIPFSLTGNDSASYYALQSYLTINVGFTDVTMPKLALVEVQLPKGRLSLDLTVQATESCILYYTFGARGLSSPSVSELLELAQNFTTGYYSQYLEGDYQHDFTLSGLRAEYDYVLYGILVDLAGIAIDSVFTIYLYTEEMYDSVRFSLRFSAPVPSDQEVTDNVMEHLATHLALNDTTRLELIPGGGNVKTFSLYNDPYSDLPSPRDLVTYMMNLADLNANIPTFQLDETYNVQNTIIDVYNPRPEWTANPVVESSLKDELNITMAVTTNGFVYVQILTEDEEIPSSRQVTLGLDAYNNPALISHRENATAGVSFTASYAGLMPATSYRIIITAINDDERLPRYMSDDLMWNVDVITQAESVAVLVTDLGLFSLVGLAVLTLI